MDAMRGELDQLLISDIYGRYNCRAALLEKITIRPRDALYVGGDVIDRGLNGVETL